MNDDRPLCRRWRAVDPAVYGQPRLVCTLTRSHRGLHHNRYSGWSWTWSHMPKASPSRMWLCQGQVEGGPRCLTKLEATCDGARAARWRVRVQRGAIDAMCPRCARPDPAVVAMCRELEASIGHG